MSERPTARQIVRTDAATHGWTNFEFRDDCDIFTRGDEELMMVWHDADTQRLAAGFSYRATPSTDAVRDKSQLCIVNARAQLAQKN